MRQRWSKLIPSKYRGGLHNITVKYSIRWTYSRMSISMKTMATQDACPAKCEVCGVIRFLRLQGQPASCIHKQLVTVYGSGFISIEKVREWCCKFDAGHTEIHDLLWSGRLNTAVNVDSITAIRSHSRELPYYWRRNPAFPHWQKLYRGIAWNDTLYWSQNFRVSKGKRSIGP